MMGYISSFDWAVEVRHRKKVWNHWLCCRLALLWKACFSHTFCKYMWLLALSLEQKRIEKEEEIHVIINQNPVWFRLYGDQRPGTVKLRQITAVSSLSSHSVTDDANNEHFIFSRTTSSHTTEMKYIGRDELLRSDLSWQANRKNTNEQLANLALINRSQTIDELVECVWTCFKIVKARV